MLVKGFGDFWSLFCLLPCRNLADGEPAQDFSFNPINEPETSTQNCPEILEMEVFKECTGTMTQCLLFTPQRNVRIQFLSVVLFLMSTDYKTYKTYHFVDVQSNRSSYTSDESLDREEISHLQRHGWSAATVKVLASMPSRTAGEGKISPCCLNVC